MDCSSELGVIAAGAGALPGARRRYEAGTRTYGRATRTCLALLAATALLAPGRFPRRASLTHDGNSSPREGAATLVRWCAREQPWSLAGQQTYTLYGVTRTSGSQPQTTLVSNVVRDFWRCSYLF